jgi:hypothetical protein
MATHTDTPQPEASLAMSLAAWDIPAAVAAGEQYVVKVGAKSSSGCALGGCRVEVLDGAGQVAGRGRLGPAPWPGTDALFWSEIELRAPSAPGVVDLTARFDATGLAEPHQASAARFCVAVVGAPEHVLTVTVTAENGPVSEAIVRAGPVRAMTDAAGRARLHLAKGEHQLVVWKAGYEADPIPLSIDAETSLKIEARRVPELHPDSIWTA